MFSDNHQLATSVTPKQRRIFEFFFSRGKKGKNKYSRLKKKKSLENSEKGKYLSSPFLFLLQGISHLPSFPSSIMLSNTDSCSSSAEAVSSFGVQQASSRVNMALKLEEWLTTKKNNGNAPPPLRPIVFNSAQGRVSGYYNKQATNPSNSVQSSTTITKKTFSRLKTSSSLDSLQNSVTTSKPRINVSSSPASTAKSLRKTNPMSSPCDMGPIVFPATSSDVRSNENNHEEDKENEDNNEEKENNPPPPLHLDITHNSTNYSLHDTTADMSLTNCGFGITDDFCLEFANVEIRGKTNDRRKSMMLTIDVDNIPRERTSMLGSANSDVSSDSPNIDPLHSSYVYSDHEPDSNEMSHNESTSDSNVGLDDMNRFDFNGMSAMDIDALIHHNDDLESRVEQAEHQTSCYQEELHAMNFLNGIPLPFYSLFISSSNASSNNTPYDSYLLTGVQEQQIMELEDIISRERLELNENRSSLIRKHRMEMKKMTNERTSYEERANQMVAQMQEQMTLLQQMAMGRIEALESELMSERHRAEALQQEVTTLHMTAKLHNTRLTSALDMKASVLDPMEDEEEEDEDEDEEEDVDVDGQEEEQEDVKNDFIGVSFREVGVNEEKEPLMI